VNQRLIAEIGKSQKLAIVNKLKRTQGLSVKELAALLKMSYMGVKQHCIDLHRDGYLDTWRRPKTEGRGRPDMVYRLTQRAHELFPVASNTTTIELLDSARELYGPASAEKLLFLVFQKKAARFAERVKGDTAAERAKWLARLRDKDGHMADLQADDGLRIVESHSPMLDLLRAYPIIARLEEEMFARVLKTPVRREETTLAGLYSCTFHIG
jgi:predicted ArsR family transcriptional regulator